jgi:hypothetical protein
MLSLGRPQGRPASQHDQKLLLCVVEVKDGEVAWLELVERRPELIARGSRFASAPPPDQSSSACQSSAQMFAAAIGGSVQRQRDPTGVRSCNATFGRCGVKNLSQLVPSWMSCCSLGTQMLQCKT